MSAPGSNGQTPNGHTPKTNPNGYGGPNGAPSAKGSQPNGKPGAPAVLNSEANAASRPTGARFGPAAMFAGPAAKAMDFKGSSKRLLRMLAPHKAIVATLLALGVIGVTLSVLGPRILGHATDLIFSGIFGKILAGEFPAGTTKAQAVAILRERHEGKLADMLSAINVTPGQGIDFNAVGRVLLLVLVLYLLASIFMYLQGRLTTVVVQRTVFTLRQQVELKLSRLPLRYFDRQSRGEILSRVTNDIDNITQTLQQTMSQIVTSLLTIVGVLAMMFWISWILALIALVTIPVSVFVAARIGKRAQPQFIQQWSTTGKLNGHIEEMFTGHSLVKVFGREQESIDVFAEHNDKLFNASFRAQFVSGLIQPTMMFIGNLNYVLVAVIGGLRVASGDLSIGSVQAFIQYSRQFSQPITQVASMANLLQSGVASAERVFELLDAEEQSPDPVTPARPRTIEGRVAFDNVSFRYDPDVPLIDDLSLAAAPGQTVAIVGPTGAGKTTLVNLIMRFYEVDGGRILLDGVDIATMSRDELREAMGMVLQDTWLFGGTIAENIAYGADNPTREQIIEAATATHVDHFVRTLPDGYDTVIDEEGSNLSAGEKQLITIARAFLSEPVILILDEATSSVDTRTEVLIQRAMSSLRQGRTSFVIAHRLSTIRDADLILVMEHGQIVEQGNHDELLAAGGAYARLYAAQFASAATDLD
jgi:ATP-binding cassette, subfamily B, multidrug efflux pump